MNRFKSKIDKYLGIAAINSANLAAYPVNLIVPLIATFLRIWVFSQLYKVSFSMIGANSVSGLTPSMTIWILALTQCFQISRPQLSRTVEQEIRSGSIAHSLTKPYSYILYHYASYMGQTMHKLVVNVVPTVFFVSFLVSSPLLTWNGIFWGLVLLFLGYLLDFLISFLIGIAALWIEDVSAVIWLYGKSMFIFGGFIIPIALLPGKFRIIAECMPFAQLYYTASSVAVSFNYSLLIKSIVSQSLWIAGMITLFAIVFQRGLKHVSINGG